MTRLASVECLLVFTFRAIHDRGVVSVAGLDLHFLLLLEIGVMTVQTPKERATVRCSVASIDRRHAQFRGRTRLARLMHRLWRVYCNMNPVDRGAGL